MADHSLFKKYDSLNRNYTGKRPRLGPDVKCVQCDGCDRVITFAVFHSEYKGGVDVCNMCRVAAEQSAGGYLQCIDRRRRICFANHPLCFVGPAPLPKGYELDKDEIDVERDPGLLARRFDRSVDVVARRGFGRSSKRPRGRHRGGAESKKNGETDGNEYWPMAKRSKRGVGGGAAAVTMAAGAAAAAAVASASASDAAAAVAATTPETAAPQASPLPPREEPTLETPPPAVVAEAEGENDTTHAEQPQNPAGSDKDSARRMRWERVANSPVAKFFLQIEPRTKSTTERPASKGYQPLCVFDHDSIQEFSVAPNRSCRTTRGFVGFTSCSSVLCVRMVPTMPEVGLWFSVMCEEESCTRLDIWHCPLKASATVSSLLNLSDAAPPVRRYVVHVGRNVALSMDWLPVPLHRTDNNKLGLCTFIRGRYLVSTVLPRDVVAEASAAVTRGGGNGGVDGVGRRIGRCVHVAAEVCGATLLKREIELVEIRWSSNGTSLAGTFLFAIGRCTSVVVLQPTGDTHSGKLMLQVVHYIEAKGVVASPPFLPFPPIAVGAARSGHTMLVVSHGTSVACYQAPEFSTKLFVAVDEVVTCVRSYERLLTMGLASGAVVDVRSGKPIATLQSPPLLIDRIDGTSPDEETWLVADTSGECTRIYWRRQGDAEPRTECVLSLARVRRAADQPAALLMGCSRMSESLRITGDSMPQFVQHPLQHLMIARGPLLAFFPDGVWVLAPQ
ncbi:hypothetical protein MOQ_007831 [Trypanosoma cruzi marinkellei]|uniref:Uncharacterized protein n=1 Tax=Trypanosoma cruzi marinkellei TaxID=85056 RepID=K2NHK1_TRYCR|nr:hypothetical protein MOQ_007831 [Trypanosoma cruzi marinkellei]